ncbi:unnamed protein product [Citrullus colocynthis]|uniref:Uncharacterized protein n=1 Tax=Citrullus colocynthis TaxID=252529 RepID=A0ABP0Z8M0_9ROSI
MDFIEARVAGFITPEGAWNTSVIKKIPLNLRNEDKLIWHYDKYGKYSSQETVDCALFNGSFIDRWHNLVTVCEASKSELLATSF